MDLQFTGDDQAFRAEVRDFLQSSLPRRIRDQVIRSPSYLAKEDARTWHKILHAKGWVAPNWPRQHGGTGWTATQKHIWDEEYQSAHAPRLSPFGLTMVGPVIYTFGNPAQKAHYLPRILSGDVFWCQGYSEPGAGSDLASLKTRAARANDSEGEDYVVNGQKIWTSHAHHADMMFCLVRTDPAAKPQEGISFLLIDMNSPGLQVRPIISIDGGHYLNEVFFTDVRVPVANRIGEENKGWTYAKFLLGHERTGIAGVAKSRTKLVRLKAMAREERNHAAPLWDDAAFRHKVSELETRLLALDSTQFRMLSREAAGHGPGAEASMLKVNGTEIEQGLNELMVEALGYYGMPYDVASLRADTNLDPVGPEYGIGVMAEHLLRRAATIYGGSNEIQRNILAKQVLKL